MQCQPIISKKNPNLVMTACTVFTLSYAWFVPLTDPLSKVELCETTQKPFNSIPNPLSTNLNYLPLEASMFTILSFQFQISIWNWNCFFWFFFIIADFSSVCFHIWGKFLVLLERYKYPIDDKVLFFYCYYYYLKYGIIRAKLMVACMWRRKTASLLGLDSLNWSFNS